MRNTILIPTMTALAVALLVTSCNKSDAKISGRFAGSDSHAIFLEQITATGKTVVDSTITNRKGGFRLRIKLPATGATFYNLKVEDETTIPLLISPGEKIRISSYYGKPGSYSIEGSRESMLIKELNDIMRAGAQKLDSLSELAFTSNVEITKREECLHQYAKEYGRLKRDQIKFIITNSGTLASLYALHQRLPNDKTLFNGDTDIVYYRLVADSVSKYYPSSPYVAALKSQIDRVDSNEEMTRLLCESIQNPASYPDISLPDMYGTTRKLSESNGKMILLDFWSAKHQASAIANAELKELYDEFSAQGFEIYQVSVDTSKQLWINTIQKQHIPWISVCDFKGLEGNAPRIYNIIDTPANYLIDRCGEIVARNIPLDKLRSELTKLTTNPK